MKKTMAGRFGRCGMDGKKYVHYVRRVKMSVEAFRALGWGLFTGYVISTGITGVAMILSDNVEKRISLAVSATCCCLLAWWIWRALKWII